MALNALDRHVALIGFMGAGKSTLGMEVAARLDRRAVDADRLIEGRVQVPLGAFFAKQGETEFRIAEAAIVRETLHILLEATPRSVDLAEIRAAMQGIEGVVGVHDLHVWSLTAQSHALASHVQVIEMPLIECEAVLERLNHQLRDHFGIHHTTIQIEVTDCPTVDGCSSPPEPEGLDAHAHHGHVHAH